MTAIIGEQTTNNYRHKPTPFPNRHRGKNESYSLTAASVILAVTFLSTILSDSIVLADSKESSKTSGNPYGEDPIYESEREHWAFRPLNRPEVPNTIHGTSIRNPIDAFVRAKLAENGLTPMPEADRRTLIRRVSFDLTGLPPTPQQVADFSADNSPDAYEKMVDRFLASPAYGERWAQHWLDLARYADTDGFEHDNARPTAWQYRDWVIRAFNEDIAFDEFLQLQLAGDEIRPADDSAHLATGFLLCGPDMPDINLRDERRDMVLNEITSTIGSVVLGLQYGCAQCHNHKYDPISQADFYRLRAFFANVDLFDKSPLGRVAIERDAVSPASHLMIRGDFRRVGPQLEPGFPRIVDDGQYPAADPNDKSKSTGRRTALARWLTDSRHPLTTRVLANRLWAFHFGKGLVANPSDVGVLSDEPVLSEMLDWLATELPRRQWSLKQMHRLIVGSATYRAMSGPGPDKVTTRIWRELQEADATNELWGRRTPVRLEGEVIRDAMLASCGKLSTFSGGPGVMVPLPKEVQNTVRKDHWQAQSDPQQIHRRSIYLFVRRNLLFPMFAVFDKPDTISSCSCRNRSTTAPQALTLFNSELAMELSKTLAGEIQTEAGGSIEKAIQLGYQRTLGRDPDNRELAFALAFLDEVKRQAGRPHHKNTDRSKATDPTPLAQFCLVLFNLNEFLYVD